MSNSPGSGSDARETPTAAELAVWEYAGLLLTYWCSARCACCYVYGGPDRGGSMSVDTAVSLWRGLDRLASRHGERMRIHLSGGEPFCDWPRLATIVRAARDAGLSPLEKIETNAFWADDDDLTRARLELLDALGMEKLVVSTDVYHQEFVPIDRVRRCVEVARAVLGRGRVRARWWEFLKEPTDLRRATAEEKQRAYAEALARHADRLTGRAADRLANRCSLHAAERFSGDDCREAILRSRHVHIDPYGHVFPGVCCGIILGTAAECSVEDVWHDVSANWRKNPVVEPLVTGGSFALMQRAREFGYRERPEGYANKCHLCAHVRQFLVDRRIWPEHVGPPECYASESDRAGTVPQSAESGLTAGEKPTITAG